MEKIIGHHFTIFIKKAWQFTDEEKESVESNDQIYPERTSNEKNLI